MNVTQRLSLLRGLTIAMDDDSRAGSLQASYSQAAGVPFTAKRSSRGRFAVHSTQRDHILEQTWPTFLDLIDSDPGRASDDFAVFAYAVLRANPPRVFGALTKELREDCSQEIVMHFLKDGFAVLRRYRNRGTPFSSWFVVVANHKVFDILRRDQKHLSSDSGLEEMRRDALVSNAEAPTDKRYEFREVLEQVVACLRTMSANCQVLLPAAAEGYDPKDMVALLPTLLRDNKHASDTLRACRKQLRKVLVEKGIDPSQFFGDRVKE